MQILALAAALAFRVITVAMFAAGIAALAAAAASLPLASQQRLPWATSLSARAAVIGAMFLGAAIGSFVMMPRRAALIRRLPRTTERIPTPVLFIAIGTCLAAALQAPSLFAWWSANRVGVEAMMGTGPDPLGLNVVPAAIINSPAALAAAALLSFAVASVLVLAVPASVAFRVLASCALVQGALVTGEYLLRREIDALGSSLMSLLQGHSVETTLLSTWLIANDHAAGVFETRLIWMLSGWLIAVAVAELVAPSGAIATVDSAAGIHASAAPLLTATPFVAPPAAASTSAPPRVDAAPESVFNQSNYSVRPRASLNPFVRRYSEYDIASIPPMSSARFAFSWATGRLTHVRDGRVVLAVAPAKAPGLLFNKSYAVTDATTGVPLGTLVPSGADWIIKDAPRLREVYVLRGESRMHSTGMSHPAEAVRSVASRGRLKRRWSAPNWKSSSVLTRIRRSVAWPSRSPQSWSSAPGFAASARASRLAAIVQTKGAWSSCSSALPSAPRPPSRAARRGA